MINEDGLFVSKQTIRPLHGRGRSGECVDLLEQLCSVWIIKLDLYDDESLSIGQPIDKDDDEQAEGGDSSLVFDGSPLMIISHQIKS